jgi:hypothetical protein
MQYDPTTRSSGASMRPIGWRLCSALALGLMAVASPHLFGRLDAATAAAGVQAPAGAKNDALVIERIRQADEYARRSGYVSALPSFHCRDYFQDPNWTRMVCGTVLFNSIGAERRWVRETEVRLPDSARVGDMFVAANDWAAARGFKGAFPSFQTQTRSGEERWVELILLKSDGIEFRDVRRQELGDARNEDWLQRFRQSFQYARRQGGDYVTAIPTGHEANYGSGVVYGTQLVRRKAAAWVDLPSIVYGFPDVYRGPQPGPRVARIGIAMAPSCRPPSNSYFCGGVLDPVGETSTGGRSVVTRITNLTGYRMKFWYADVWGTWRGGVLLDMGGSTTVVSGLPLAGTIYAVLDDGVYYNQPTGKTHPVEVEYFAPFEPVGAPRPYPTALRAPQPDRYYRIVSPANLVLDVEANACADGARVIAWPAHGGDNQAWRFRGTGRGSYVIENRASQRVLDIENVSTANGASAQQWARVSGGGNQEFIVEPVGNLFRIRAVHSRRVLDIRDRSALPGASLQQWDWLGGDNWNQQWRLEPIDDRPFAPPTPVTTTCG